MPHAGRRKAITSSLRVSGERHDDEAGQTQLLCRGACTGGAPRGPEMVEAVPCYRRAAPMSPASPSLDQHEGSEPLTTNHVPSLPWNTRSFMEPDWTTVPWLSCPTTRQPVRGTLDHTPPWTANHCAAASGDAWPPVSTAKETLKPLSWLHDGEDADAGAGAATGTPQALVPSRTSARPARARRRGLMHAGIHRRRAHRRRRTVAAVRPTCPHHPAARPEAHAFGAIVKARQAVLLHRGASPARHPGSGDDAGLNAESSAGRRATLVAVESCH